MQKRQKLNHDNIRDTGVHTAV